MVEMLGPLPARPPTPPRPGSRIDQDHPGSPAIAQTPGDSPHGANSSRAPPSSRGSKRVTFSPWLHTTIDAQTSNKSKPKDSPFKSILKETNSPIPVWSPKVNTFTAESLAMLLESVMQQLAGESITSRLDAYMQFFGALRTYDGLPAGKDIADKLNLITDFIQRDVSRDLVNGTPLDTNLANQALKLSAAFVWHADISTQLSEEFKIFLVEHSISFLHEAKAPKSVLTHYMSILSTQNFGPKVMTTARVTRLLAALQDISNHVTGKAIALHRLSIYQRLLAQSKSTFISQSPLWAEHLIFGLLHHMKDTRIKAISLGFQISVAVGSTNVVSKTIRDIFDRPLENDRKLVTEVRERLSRMMASTESGLHVPQVWGVIILLLRSKNRNLEKWEHFKDWVLVLQKCFNCSEPAIKAQAILSWNRFVYAVGPNESTTPSLLRMLGKPIISQFDRKKSDKSGSTPTQLALGSYYNLLYYAFRPSLPHGHLDLIWEEYVANPSATIFSTVPALSNQAFRAISNLLWSSQAKMWTETRITDTNRIEAEELPSVDPRWVRSRVSSIVKVFESLFKSSVWNDNAIETSNVALAWNNLSSALSLASSKEITPSGESMQAVANILGLLQRLLEAGPPSLNAVGDNCIDVFFDRFRFLSITMISSLGGIPCTEKLLLRTVDETFGSDNAITSRRSQPGTTLDSPVLHLLRAISTCSTTQVPTPSYISLVEGVIGASCKGKISRGSRLELLQQCTDLTAAETSPSLLVPALLAVVWKATARATADALQSFPMESARERDGSVSRDYENVNKILTAGLQFLNVYEDWSQLLDVFVRVARTERGNLVLATLIVEPMAASLMNLSVRDTYLPFTSLLSHSLTIPFSKDAGANAGPGVTDPQSPSPFPQKLMDSMGRTLRGAYDEFSVSETQGLAVFIESLTSFLSSGASQFRSDVLEALQSSLEPWVKDSGTKLDVKHGVDSRILTACRALSSAVLSILQTSVVDDLTSFAKFELIIFAGLESSHLTRTQKFVDFWNSTRSGQEVAARNTRVGQSVKTSLDRLRTSVSQENLQEPTTLAPNAQQEADVSIDQAQIPSFGPSGARAFVHLHSSPVVGASDTSIPDASESNEPQLPMTSQPQGNESRVGDDTTLPFQGNRREMFRMIEAIRSSSPVNTPGKLGYDTPVHLRRLHAFQSGDIPLTPTLAPTENEEAFIGSSPTPATRDPTPASKSDAVPALPQDVSMSDAPDIPSSPPELDSRSPSPQKRSTRSRNARKRNARARNAIVCNSVAAQNEGQGSVASPVNTNQAAPPSSLSLPADNPEKANETVSVARSDENPSNRRLRSGLSQNTQNDEVIASVPVHGTPEKQTDVSSAPNSKSKSASKKRRRRGASKSIGEEIQQPPENPQPSSALATAEVLVDSSSEELDTQIASQLEQDLELAVDLGGSSQDTQKAQKAEETPANATRKRKREEEDVRSTAAKERRRSTRLSSTKDIAPVQEDDPNATQSQDAPAAPASQDTSVATSTSSAPRRATRSSQKKGDDLAENSLPVAEVSQATQESVKEQEVSQPPSKRSRRSYRPDEQTTSEAVETPSRTQSTRSARSRKTRSSQKSRPSRDEVTSVAPVEPSQAEDHQPEVIPGSITAGENDSQAVPLVSTEEATDSQMTDIGPLDEPPAETTDIQPGMDVNAVPDVAVAPEAEPATSVTTSGIQTDPPAAPESDSSEGGITQSLKKLLRDMKSAILGPSALREVDDLLFNIRVEAHDASRRQNHPA